MCCNCNHVLHRALQYDDESEEEDLRISISEADTGDFGCVYKECLEAKFIIPSFLFRCSTSE